MSSKTRTLAIALSAVLVLSVLGTGAAMAAENETVDDDEGDDLDAETTNETDDGNETVDDNETDDGNETVDDNETDDAAVQPFGQVVTAYVHGLIDGSNDTNDTNTTNATNGTDAPLGQQIAAFVVANNPGNAPDHAGPGSQPDHAGAGNETGGPAHAGPGNETGPPEHAGPGGEDDDADGDDEKGGGGPPAHAGNDD